MVLSSDNFALYLWDGVYDQNTYDAIDDENEEGITVYVMDHNEGAPYLYTWKEDGQINGEWPGKQMTKTVTLEDGSRWYKQTFNVSSLNAIVTYNDGKQTEDIKDITKDIYLSYYKGSDKKHTDFTSYYEEKFDLGDVNKDRKLTVADVMLLVKMLLAQ